MQDNSNLLADFGYTSSNMSTSVDTRDLREPMELPELNIAPPRIKEDPDTRAKRASREIPEIVSRIRQEGKITYADRNRFGNELADNLRRASESKGIKLIRNDVPMEEAYTKLNSGDYIPKFESFVADSDNEERLARQQGTWQKWSRGLQKLVAKTTLYAVGGVVNPVYGAIEAIKEGNFNAIYNNDFMKYMDDMDTRLNHNLANYYTQEEKNRSFGGKMLTANFWANDVLGGMAFTLGALGSEAAWAYATGGASLAGTAGRMGLRAAGKTAGRLLARDALSGVKSAANAYLRSASKAYNIAAAVNNGRFIMTSAGWEAAVEASHFMKEAELNFVKSYKKTYGKNPTAEELAEFRDKTANAGNTVFAANIGIVGLSNILQFGQYFGAGFDVAKKTDRAINKFFGLGTKFDKAGNLERIKVSKLRKGLGITYNVFKRPFTEGVWEEGNQGAVSEAAKSWIASRFDPEATKKNIDAIDALKDGFAHTYGTQEGRMEVGIGALIGALMGVGGGRATGFGGITEYSNESKRLDAIISNYNSQDVARSAVDLVNRFASLNQQLHAMEEGAKAEENGDIYQTRHSYDMSLFTKFKTENELGLLDDGAKNFQHVLENMSNEEIAKEYNISEEEAALIKIDILDDYNERLEDFRTSQRLAESIGANSTGYTDYLALNAFLGTRAERGMIEAAGDISDLMDDPSYGKALLYYSRLSEEGRKLVEEKKTLNEEVAKLEAEIQDINTRITEEGSKEQYADRANRLSQVNQRLADITQELDQYSQSQTPVEEGSINNWMFNGNEFSKLDQISSALRKSGDPKDKLRADKLDVLSAEFAQLYADYKSVNEMLLRIRDPRFMAKEERGILKLLRGDGIKYDESLIDPDLLSKEGELTPINKELEDKINKGLEDGTLSEEEAYTLRTFSNMRREYIAPGESNYDPISDERWEMYNQGVDLESFYNEVAEKKYDEVKLSEREQRIYDNNKDIIDKINADKGDSPMSRLRRIQEKLDRAKNANLKSARDSNDRIIEDTIASAPEEEQNAIRDAIDERNRLVNEIDEGKDIDLDRLTDLEDEINQFGNKYGVDMFMDFIEQNRIIDKGEVKFIPTATVSLTDDLVDHRMPPESSNGGVSFDNAQNIEMLTAKKDKSGNNMIISGLRPKVLADMIAEKMGGTVSKSQKKADGAWVLSVGGVDIRIYPNSEHSSSKIPMGDLEKLQELSIRQSYGFIFTLQPALASANSREVLFLDFDGSLSIIPTNTTYGKDGKDTISDEDVLNTKVGDRLIARVDFADDYNRSLWSKYKSALKKYEKAVSDYKADRDNEGLVKIMEQEAENLEKAKSSLRNNLVIKLVNNENNDGRFVSVAKALPSTVDASAGQSGLLDIREKAANLFMSNASSRKSGYIDVGTYAVNRTLPGRPSLNMRMVDDKIEVEYIPVTPSAAEHIVSVGYMMNGKMRVRDRADFSSHPFMSLVARESKNPGDKYYGVKVPFVVIKHPNGTNYAYPVQVGERGNEERISFADDLTEMAGGDWLRLIEREDIIGLNTAALNYGVNPENFIRLAGTFEEIRSDINRMVEAIKSMPDTLDVGEWINSPRSSKEIAMDDVRININLDITPFHAPKLVVDLSGTKSVIAEEGDVDSDFANIPQEDLDNLFGNTDMSQAEKEIKSDC